MTDGAKLGRFALVSINTRRIAVLPDRIVELGNFESNVALIRERDPTGKTIQVRIKLD